MLPEFGQILLILALLTALLQGLLPLIGAQRRRTAWMAVARPAAYVQLSLLASAFALLTYAFLGNDFSVQYVAENSHSLLPTLYRSTAVWGAHEDPSYSGHYSWQDGPPTSPYVPTPFQPP